MTHTIIATSNTHLIKEIKKLDKSTDYNTLRLRNSHKAWVTITAYSDSVVINHVNGGQAVTLEYIEYNSLARFCWAIVQLVWSIK